MQLTTPGSAKARAARTAWQCISLLLCMTMPATAQTLQPLQDLAIGDVITGTVRAVQPTDPGAAAFSIYALPNRDIHVQLSLPAGLQAAGSTLSITFDPDSGAWSTTETAVGSTRFDPASGVWVRTAGGQRTIYFWLGARVAPPLMQQTGEYGGVVTITATFP